MAARAHAGKQTHAPGAVRPGQTPPGARGRRNPPPARGASRIHWDRVGRIALTLVLAAVLYSYLNPAIDFVKTYTATTAAKAEFHELLAENKRLHSRIQTADDPIVDRAGKARAQGMVAEGETPIVVRGLEALSPPRRRSWAAVVSAGSYILSAWPCWRPSSSRSGSARSALRRRCSRLGGRPGAPGRGDRRRRPADLARRAARDRRAASTLGPRRCIPAAGGGGLPGPAPSGLGWDSRPSGGWHGFGGPPEDSSPADLPHSRVRTRRPEALMSLITVGVIAVVFAHWGLTRRMRWTAASSTSTRSGTTCPSRSTWCRATR